MPETITWRWDESIQRYREVKTGRLMRREQAIALAEQSLSASISVVDTLAGYVANGQITPADFAELFWREIRGEYIRQYLSAIGGREMMTPADWGRIGGMLKEQKGYYDKFMLELPNLSEGQIRSRAQMYINSAREANERAHSIVSKRWGVEEVLWELGQVQTEHCSLCPQWAGMGWQPIGPNGGYPTDMGESWPGDGKTCEGMTNCKCRLRFRKADGKEFPG